MDLYKGCDLAERIEMSRLPAELAPGLLAGQALVERIAARPLTELCRNGIGRNDFRIVARRGEALCKGARDAADGERFDRGADIALAPRCPLQRKRIERGKVVAMHQR